VVCRVAGGPAVIGYAVPFDGSGDPQPNTSWKAGWDDGYDGVDPQSRTADYLAGWNAGVLDRERSS
jgi:hypothetical protein